MPHIFEYHCTSETCSFSAPDGWGYYMYAIADDGERVHCPHPGETRRAREVVGSDASEDELDERTGFTYHSACVDCAEQFDRDPSRDDLQCPACGSYAVQYILELVGSPCPACLDGTFTKEDTHAIA